MLKNFLNIERLLEPESTASELLKRSEIDSKYKWNLNDIYESLDDWEKDFNWIKENYKKVNEAEGKLGESAKELSDALKLQEELGIKFGHLFLYAMLDKDVDLANGNAKSRFDRVILLNSEVGAALSFIEPEILSIEENKLYEFIDSDEHLKIYKHYFDNLIRTKKHILSKEQEEILALASPVTGLSSDVFSIFNNADIKFPKAEDSEGNEVQITHGRYTAGMHSTDRVYRKNVYKGLYKPYQENVNTFGALFNGNIQASVFNAKARKYDSTLEASLDRNNIPVKVYDNLIETVNENLDPLHRWCALRKKLLKYDEFHPYDTYVTLFQKTNKEYSYDESMNILLEAFQPLGDKYVKDVETAFNNRWIDVYETKGKRSGAYSSGTTYGMHPYVLLNWNNQLNDVFTFAHEMGHNMHSYYTGDSQPFPYANYSIFVAEVASTTNEAILHDFLLKNVSTKEEKLALIEKKLTSIVTTFYRQTRFAEYEKLVHELTQKGEVLTTDRLTELFRNMYAKYWGETMKVDEEEGLSWARIPHFYYNFYVYQYATSFAASEAIAANLLNDKKVVEKYLGFLSAGSSKYPIDLLRETGADLTKPEVIKYVVTTMNKLLDEIEEII